SPPRFDPNTGFDVIAPEGRPHARRDTRTWTTGAEKSHASGGHVRHRNATRAHASTPCTCRYVVDAPDTPNRTGSDAAPRVSAHRDDGFPVAFGVAVLLGDAQGLGDEGLDDLVFGDGLDDLPFHEDLSLAVA